MSNGIEKAAGVIPEVYYDLIARVLPGFMFYLKCKKRTPVKADRLNGEMNFCQPHKTAQRPYWLGDFWFST